MTGKLNGYVDINVHDKVWTEVHVGLINTKFDIFLAEICYKGRLSYSTNIMKVIDLLVSMGFSALCLCVCLFVFV